ncbi:hypothetical protein CRG95_22900 [Escherichia sp. E4208]|nr:hypothetical protein CRG95_22900 [Escherichia sp. E4208]
MLAGGELDFVGNAKCTLLLIRYALHGVQDNSKVWLFFRFIHCANTLFFFVITLPFSNIYTCMVVAQLRRFHASRQAMQGIEHEDRKG